MWYCEACEKDMNIHSEPHNKSTAHQKKIFILE